MCLKNKEYKNEEIEPILLHDITQCDAIELDAVLPLFARLHHVVDDDDDDDTSERRGY